MKTVPMYLIYKFSDRNILAVDSVLCIAFHTLELCTKLYRLIRCKYIYKLCVYFLVFTLNRLIPSRRRYIRGIAEHMIVFLELFFI